MARVTKAVTIHGHFGEWLQGRLGPNGPVCLVTLPCDAFSVQARSGSICDSPLPFDTERLVAFASRLGLKVDDWPSLTYDMPIGAGTGASTAALVALAQAAGFKGTPQTLAAACLTVEGATDPIMMPAPDQVLWASRQACVLRKMPPPAACTILGGFWGSPVKTQPDDHKFADITDLVDAWKQATANSDVSSTAAIATEAATRSHIWRDPALSADPMPDLCRDLGAMGFVRAHTGSARGLVFERGGVPDHGESALREAGLSSTLIFDAGGP